MRRIAAFIGILAVLAAGFFLLGNSKSAEGPAMSGGSPAGKDGGKDKGGKGAMAVPVLVAEVNTRDVRQVLEVTGALKTDQDVQVGARIEGKVVGVTAKEGDHVTQGQVLVRLADRALRAQKAHAQAVLPSAEAELSLAKNGSTAKDTSAATDLDRAQANLNAAKIRVAQDETSLQLVDVETRTRVEAAQANLTSAKQRLQITKDLTRKQELRQAELAVQQAMALMNQAKVDEENAHDMFDRRQSLFKQDAIAKEEVDNSERSYKAAQANSRVASAAVDVARQKLDLAKEGSRPEEVRVAAQAVRAAAQDYEQAKSDQGKKTVAQQEIEAARAAETQAEAAVRAAKAGLVLTKVSVDTINDASAAVIQARTDIEYYNTRLADMTIKAPVSGIVSTANVHVGEMVTTSTKLFDLVALDTVFFEAVVPELEISLVKPGVTSDVTIDSMPGQKFQGVVREVIPVADAASKSYRGRVAVLTKEHNLPANGFARGTISVGTKKDVIAVSKDSIYSEGGDKYVWLVTDDGKGGTTVKRQTVVPGVSDSGYMQILSGLKPGQQVVASGSPAIVEGTAVKVQGNWKNQTTPNGPPGSVPFGADQPTGLDSGDTHGHRGGHGKPAGDDKPGRGGDPATVKIDAGKS